VRPGEGLERSSQCRFEELEIVFELAVFGPAALLADRPIEKEEGVPLTSHTRAKRDSRQPKQASDPPGRMKDDRSVELQASYLMEKTEEFTEPKMLGHFPGVSSWLRGLCDKRKAFWNPPMNVCVREGGVYRECQDEIADPIQADEQETAWV